MKKVRRRQDDEKYAGLVSEPQSLSGDARRKERLE
jgi:hypothetical protein